MGREDRPPRLKGALARFFKSACEITSAENVLTVHIINSEDRAGLPRTTLYGSLMREYLYLAEGNSSASAVPQPGGCRVPLPIACARYEVFSS